MKKVITNLLQILAVLFISYFLLFEVVLRFAVKPAENSYGSLFGYELPPFDLPPVDEPPELTDRSEWHDQLIVDGKKITVGDLWGYYRYDPELGYVPLEDTVSPNGWWQANSIGALARAEITEKIRKGSQRILVFGDSYSSGSRVPLESAWPSILNSMSDDIEVVNFGVDGYGMTQSYLRYLQLRDKLDYDIVLLMFVPSADLWREINLRRDLRDWEIYWLMPRFTVDGGDLTRVDTDFRADSRPVVSAQQHEDEALRSFLRTYDRFYFNAKYEDPWLIGKSMLYKLLAKVYYESKTNQVTHNLQAEDSEALLISQKIFERMNREVNRDGKQFILIVLPSEHELTLFEQDTAYKNNWDRMVSDVCGTLLCIDLSEDMSGLTSDRLDSGYDGTHYGPRGNELIANLIMDHLVSFGIVGSTVLE